MRGDSCSSSSSSSSSTSSSSAGSEHKGDEGDLSGLIRVVRDVARLTAGTLGVPALDGGGGGGRERPFGDNPWTVRWPSPPPSARSKKRKSSPEPDEARATGREKHEVEEEHVGREEGRGEIEEEEPKKRGPYFKFPGWQLVYESSDSGGDEIPEYGGEREPEREGGDEDLEHEEEEEEAGRERLKEMFRDLSDAEVEARRKEGLPVPGDGAKWDAWMDLHVQPWMHVAYRRGQRRLRGERVGKKVSRSDLEFLRAQVEKQVQREEKEEVDGGVPGAAAAGTDEDVSRKRREKMRTEDQNEAEEESEDGDGANFAGKKKRKKKKKTAATGTGPEEGGEGMDVDLDGSGFHGGPAESRADAEVAGTGFKVTAYDEMPGVSESMAERLRGMGFSGGFPVQVAVLEALKEQAEGDMIPRDLVVTAPTGSGKTLAYAVPVVASLENVGRHRVRALVVVPTRDLAKQVGDVFMKLIEGTTLQVKIMTGGQGLKAELEEEFAPVDWRTVDMGVFNFGPVDTGHTVDIVVATPGKLVDALLKRKLKLDWLEWLVIDETDRMLKQEYQSWLPIVLDLARPRPVVGSVQDPDDLTLKTSLPRLLEDFDVKGDVDGTTIPVWDGEDDDPWVDEEDLPGYCPATGGRMWLDVAGVLHVKHGIAYFPHHILGPEVGVPHLRKLLFSATMTTNPMKIAQLKLFRPREIKVVEGSQAGRERGADGAKDTPKYSLPSSLVQFKCVVKANIKPLALIAILHRPEVQKAKTLVFAKSVEATHRLFRLIQAFGDIPGVDPREYSSLNSQTGRTRALEDFRSGAANVLVCSDAMARGIDLAGVNLVISYDVAPAMKSYVHRVGRTARAGRAGTSITLLKREQARYFKAMLRKGSDLPLKDLKVAHDEIGHLWDRYETALNSLRETVEREERIHGPRR